MSQREDNLNKPQPLMLIMLTSFLDRHGPFVTIALPYTTREQAEHAQRIVQETCPLLLVELEICSGEWRLVVSRNASSTSLVSYDN